MLIPKAAVGEQNGHINDVEVRQDVLKATSQAIGQRACQVSCVVEMTCPAPKSGGHQLAVVLGAIHGCVGALDVLWLLPPDPAVAIGATEEVLLVVSHSEDVITQQAQHQDPYGMSCAQLDRMVNQIQTLGSTKTISHLLPTETYTPDELLNYNDLQQTKKTNRRRSRKMY